jgi:formylglycine-generating enzyme required for sulfatase activity
MPPGPKIFLSYRREDSAFQTTAIHEKLVDAFGGARVFMDVDNIPAGRDFRTHLQMAIAQCDVFLAVIGEHWLDACGPDGQRRLDNPRDFVRIELEAALSRDIPVIPLLLGSAVVPPAESLPESLRELSYRNALSIRPGRDFKNDIQLLISQIHTLPHSHERSAPVGESALQVERPVIEQPEIEKPRSAAHELPTASVPTASMPPAQCVASAAVGQPPAPPTPPVEQSPSLSLGSGAGTEERAKIQYFIRRGSQVSGPFSSRALKELSASGMLTPDDDISQDKTVWTVARKVRGLRFETESPIIVPLADRQVQVPPWALAAKPRPETPPPSSGGGTAASPQPQPSKPQSRSVRQAGEARQDNGLAMKFMSCPRGTFLMGSPPSEKDREFDEDQVHVTLSSGFWLGKYPVTQAEWERLMRTSPWKGKVFVKEGHDYPATYVNWDEASEFAEKLTQQERKAGRLPDDWSYVLPTEAQWEYACRAATCGRFSFGDLEPRLDEFAWYSNNTSTVREEFAHRVGRKQPNAWGLYDMHGNVWEWCRDLRSDKLPGGTDPEVTTWGTDRVCRGGGWLSDAPNCRSAIRFGYPPVHRSFNLGFRVALTAVGQASTE